MMTDKVQALIRLQANKNKARALAKYFQTGPGQYAQNDQFLGLSVPQCRQLATKFFVPILDLRPLLASQYHEERLIALLMLIDKYQVSSPARKKILTKFYLTNRRAVNNWDLVDISAPQILGDHLLNNKGERKILVKLAASPRLWDRRIAIVSTLTLIRQQQFTETLKLAKRYLTDQEDLIHKATGWMLREVGKRDKQVLLKFLKANSKAMPRTMLRYAIEKFTPKERQTWLKKSRSLKK